MLQDATFWVAVAFVCFVLLTFKKVSAILGSSLDARGARIRQELEEAQRLREDAEKVLAECQKRQNEAEAEAEKIIAHAREEAVRVRQRAEAEVQAALKRREAQAVDRIAQAEAQALAEVRNVAVDVALSASRRVFSERLASKQPDPLIDQSITSLSGLLN